MATGLRIERPGGTYQVGARVNGRKDLFREDTDRFHFMELLSEIGERFGGGACVWAEWREFGTRRQSRCAANPGKMVSQKRAVLAI